MTDVHNRVTRSRNMAAIRGMNTTPELVVRKWLHREGFRYVLHDRRLPGRPDIVFPRYRAVLFVHGCFWHQHRGCRYATTPASNAEFWAAKLSANARRDRQVRTQLHRLGWRVLTIWECEVPKIARIAKVAQRIGANPEHAEQ
jgi:DNA mismatch endonuclease, patch repair protein